MARDFQLKYCFFLFLCAIALEKNAEALNTIFMENLCGKSSTYNVKLNVMTSGILKSVRRDSWNKEIDCTVAFLPDPGASVVLSFYRYSLGADDQLMVTDNDNHKILLHGNGNFQDERKSFFSDGLVTVHYRSNSSNQLTPEDGFQLTFTQTKELPCSSKHFQCDNKRCIDNDLACDGHNHCGDNSDQRSCVPKTSQKNYDGRQDDLRAHHSIGMAVSLGASILVIISLIIVIIIYSVRKRKEDARNKAQPPNVEPKPSVSTICHSPSGHEIACAPGHEVVTVHDSFQKSEVTAGHQESIEGHPIQVPALYPNLGKGSEQPPTAPDFEEGHSNPAFSAKE